MVTNSSALPVIQLRKDKADLSALEAKIANNLPPIFKTFVQNFDPDFVNHQLLHKGELHTFVAPIAFVGERDVYSIDDDEFSLLNFRTVEEMINCQRSNIGNLEGYLLIANHGFMDGLVVCISGINIDKIFFKDEGGNLELISNNIYEFIPMIKYVKYDFYNIGLDNLELYKNENETFWRTKSTAGHVI